MLGIVLFTHGEVAAALRDTAETILGPVEGLAAAGLPAELDRATAWTRLEAAIEAVDVGDGVLILVDMFGGTPSNLALARLAEGNVEVLTGVNLAMVLRSIQRRNDHDLTSLAQDVLKYGRRNVTASTEWKSARARMQPSPLAQENPT
jgi:mannose PTS system EIIA component